MITLSCLGHLGKSVLLPFWLSLPCVCYSYSSLCRSYYCNDLLSVVCGGKWSHDPWSHDLSGPFPLVLPLVVALVHNIWLPQLLCLYLLSHLLLYQGKLYQKYLLLIIVLPCLISWRLKISFLLFYTLGTLLSW